MAEQREFQKIYDMIKKEHDVEYYMRRGISEAETIEYIRNKLEVVKTRSKMNLNKSRKNYSCKHNKVKTQKNKQCRFQSPLRTYVWVSKTKRIRAFLNRQDLVGTVAPTAPSGTAAPSGRCHVSFLWKTKTKPLFL